MSRNDVSRRGFMKSAAGAAATSAVLTMGTATSQVTQLPDRVWIILGVNWECNDEFCYEAGEFLEPKVYFDKEEAITVCRKLCADFYLQLPQEFDLNWDAYDVDPDTATWEDLRQVGFPDPYSVKEFLR